MADSKVWLWLLIFGVLFMTIAIIALMFGRREWWVWTLLIIGGLILIGGLISWIMTDHDDKSLVISTKGIHMEHGAKSVGGNSGAKTHGTTQIMSGVNQ